MLNKKEFYENVLNIVSMIPYGKLTTYGIIAQYAGSKISSRYVGYILSTLKGRMDYPCHRVLNRNGILTGKFNFNDGEMIGLLESEGHQIVDDQVLNFKDKLWKP